MYQGLAGGGTQLQFTYDLQSTDMDDKITIADPPLVNPESITAVVKGNTAIASNDRISSVWNWPAGQTGQIVKVDGQPNATPSFPDVTTEITLLQSAQYKDDASALYLRNSLPAATSPTIANYGDLPTQSRTASKPASCTAAATACIW